LIGQESGQYAGPEHHFFGLFIEPIDH
jgi:hypothetical protein